MSNLFNNWFVRCANQTFNSYLPIIHKHVAKMSKVRYPQTLEWPRLPRPPTAYWQIQFYANANHFPDTTHRQRFNPPTSSVLFPSFHSLFGSVKSQRISKRVTSRNPLQLMNHFPPPSCLPPLLKIYNNNNNHFPPPPPRHTSPAIEWAHSYQEVAFWSRVCVVSRHWHLQLVAMVSCY